MSESNGYIGRSPGDASIVLAREYFQPTGAGKTFLFSSGYDPGYVDVYRNGVKLINVLDYAATDGKNIVLDTPVGVGSTVQVVAYKAFNLGTVESSTNDFTVGTNLLVQSGFGSFGQGITANEINVSGIGTIGIGSFVDIHVSGGATVAGTLVANSFSGDGSALTGVANTDYVVSIATTTGNLNVSAAATITGALTGSTGTFSGAINIDATTASTSTSTGALIVDGGVGIAKDIFVGDAIDVAKDLKVGAAASFTGIVTTTGDLYVGDSIDVANDALVGSAATIAGVVKITDSTSSTSTSTGALIVSGGAGIAGDVWIGAGLSVAGTLTHEDVTSIDSVGLITAKSGVNVSGGQVTIGTGITMGIAGVATFSGTSDVHLLDNVQLNVGDGSDLAIYHNGTDSYIKGGTSGELVIRHDAITMQAVSSTDTYFDAVHNGAVSLRYNNSTKFETTNDGTVTTGIATATLGIDAAISVWTLGASGSSHYTFTGPGNLSATTDPTLNLKRGQKYTFKNRSGGHPFRIQSTPNGSTGTQYNTGVTNNDGGNGTNILFDVPYNAPNVLYYQCTSHGSMGGAMYIDGSAYEISVGTGITFGSAGVATFSGTSDVHLVDNVQLNFGNGKEGDIYRDSAQMIINNDGGNLKLRSTSVHIAGLTNEKHIVSNTGVGVTLFYNNSAKLETSNTGVTITGKLSPSGNIHMPDNVGIKLGASDDLNIWHYNVDNKNYISTGAATLKVQSTGDETLALFIPDGAVELNFNGAKKIETTNDGSVITGITTFTKGCDFTGILREKHTQVDAKLSADVNINLENGMLHYYSVNETTTAAPNIRYNASKTLNNMMNIGETVTVTIIYKPNGAGYYADLNVDGNGITEEWNGGSAPSSANAGGYDILTHTLFKVANQNFLCFSNVQNYA